MKNIKTSAVIIKSGLLYLAVIGVVAYLMYDSGIAVIPLMAGYPLFYRWYIIGVNEKRDARVASEFVVFLTSLSGALNAGYALENTIKVAIDDLDHEYPGGDSILIPECEEVLQQLSLNRSFENAIVEMSERLGNKDIKDFAGCLALAKGLGGNVLELIELTLELFKDKAEIKADICLMVSAKKLEKNIMLIVPFFMIAFLKISNPGYLDVLYGNPLGVVVMSFCIAVIVTSFVISEKIIDIRV